MEVFVSVYSIVLILLLHRKIENNDKVHFRETKNEKSNTEWMKNCEKNPRASNESHEMVV